MNLLPLIVVFPMFVAIIFNYLNGKDKLIRPMTLLMAILLLALPFIGSYGIYNFGAHGLENGLISGISYLYTPVKQLIITVIMLIGSLVLITGLGEKKSSGLFVALMLMGLASVSAVVLADDLFNIYVFYEIAAIAQTGLVIASGTEKAYRAAFRYLILGNFAGSILLLGVSMLLAATGTLNI